MVARGLRNNNPFNIKKSSIKWQGKIDNGTDSVFEQFTTPVYGIRAGVINCKTLVKNGSNTIYKLIKVFAPPIENDTNAYMTAVAKHLNMNVDEVLDMDDYETVYALTCAIMLHENGTIPYSDSQINAALYLAGVVNVPQPSFWTKVRTLFGAT